MQNGVEIFAFLPYFVVEEALLKWEKVTRKNQLKRFLIGLSDSNQVTSTNKLYIVLKSTHNKWLSAKDDAKTIRNDQTNIGRKEKFEISFTSDGYVALKTWRGKFFSAQPNGQLEANRDRLASWEKFQMFVYGDAIVALKSIHGKWLSAQSDGKMEVNRNHLYSWEKFYPWQKGNSDMIWSLLPKQRFKPVDFETVWNAEKIHTIIAYLELSVSRLTWYNVRVQCIGISPCIKYMASLDRFQAKPSQWSIVSPAVGL